MATNEKSSAVLTDAEIKKALECCPQDDPNHNCARCAYKPIEGFCFDYLMKDVLDLINRLEADKETLIAGQETLQKALAEKNAEIERLIEFLDDKCDRCIEKERIEAIKEVADNLYRVFAGHSDYHGDTILTKIICLKEGKPLRTAEPIDTSKIKYAAIKEFAERLKDTISYLETQYFDEDITMDKIREEIDNLVKEMVGEQNANSNKF